MPQEALIFFKCCSVDFADDPDEWELMLATDAGGAARAYLEALHKRDDCVDEIEVLVRSEAGGALTPKRFRVTATYVPRFEASEIADPNEVAA